MAFRLLGNFGKQQLNKIERYYVKILYIAINSIYKNQAKLYALNIRIYGKCIPEELFSIIQMYLQSPSCFR